MADECVGRRAVLNGKCLGQGRVSCKIKWEVRDTENGVEKGRHCLGGSCENPWMVQQLVAMVDRLLGFGRSLTGGAGCKQGFRFVGAFFVKKKCQC